MKNFEKYEKEIREEIEKDGNLYTLAARLSCSNIVEGYELTKWLYEEYEEPLLTDEDREYLDIFIEPFRNKIDCIRFYSDSVDIFYKENCYVSYDLKLPIKMCKANLKLGKDYSLEELGLKKD